MVVSQLLDTNWLAELEWLHSLVQGFGYARAAATFTGIYAAYKVTYALFFSPLRHLPGPFLARLTNKRAEIIALFGWMGEYAREESEKYGDTYVYQPKAVSISNPIDARTVYASHAFPKTHFYDLMDILDTETTLSTRSPDLASMRRRQLGPYFHHGYLQRMEPTIIKHGFLAIKDKWDALISESAGGKTEVVYSREFLLTTFDVTSALAFGRELGSLKNNDVTIADWVASTLSYLWVRPMFARWPKPLSSLILSPLEKKHDALIAFSGESIARRREFLLTAEEKPADLLQAMIDAEDPESKLRMEPTEVHAESVEMLLAGSETSSNTLTWTLHFLMLYPQHYRRAVEEVRSAFDKDSIIRYSEGRSKLPFVEACLYESMRLWPVSGGQIVRGVPEGGITLRDGSFVPGGYEVNVNMQGVNLHKEFWNEPHLFDPTRFLDNEDAKHNVITFSWGVRICPGRHLAWMEMITILANLLKDYDFALPADYTHRGPNVLDKRGYPKLMDAQTFLVSTPKNPERDCRIVVSKRST
ncbi:cytochrome P450 [Martensiomyces pterosporus]|nr:cytochrome P450 [Martensiomyces pterosporus]